MSEREPAATDASGKRSSALDVATDALARRDGHEWQDYIYRSQAETVLDALRDAGYTVVGPAKASSPTRDDK